MRGCGPAVLRFRPPPAPAPPLGWQVPSPQVFWLEPGYQAFAARRRARWAKLRAARQLPSESEAESCPNWLEDSSADESRVLPLLTARIATGSEAGLLDLSGAGGKGGCVNLPVATAESSAPGWSRAARQAHPFRTRPSTRRQPPAPRAGDEDWPEAIGAEGGEGSRSLARGGKPAVRDTSAVTGPSRRFPLKPDPPAPFPLPPVPLASGRRAPFSVAVLAVWVPLELGRLRSPLLPLPRSGGFCRARPCHRSARSNIASPFPPRCRPHPPSPLPITGLSRAAPLSQSGHIPDVVRRAGLRVALSGCRRRAGCRRCWGCGFWRRCCGCGCCRAGCCCRRCCWSPAGREPRRGIRLCGRRCWHRGRGLPRLATGFGAAHPRMSADQEARHQGVYVVRCPEPPDLGVRALQPRSSSQCLAAAAGSGRGAPAALRGGGPPGPHQRRGRGRVGGAADALRLRPARKPNALHRAPGCGPRAVRGAGAAVRTAATRPPARRGCWAWRSAAEGDTAHRRLRLWRHFRTGSCRLGPTAGSAGRCPSRCQATGRRRSRPRGRGRWSSECSAAG